MNRILVFKNGSGLSCASFDNDATFELFRARNSCVEVRELSVFKGLEAYVSPSTCVVEGTLEDFKIHFNYTPPKMPEEPDVPLGEVEKFIQDYPSIGLQVLTGLGY
jgi:hypothetical protein